MKVRSFYCLFHFEMEETNSQYTEGGSRNSTGISFLPDFGQRQEKSATPRGICATILAEAILAGSPAPPCS